MGNPVASSHSTEIPESQGYAQTVIHPDVQAALDGSNGTAAKAVAETQQKAPLGILKGFESKTFQGFGFNTIFRPFSHNKKTPTKFDVDPQSGGFPQDNILQLNHTKEIMKFDLRLGAVPNRGLFTQADINLNGVPYTQKIFDMMDPQVDKPMIHFENGLWMHVPESTNPALPASYARMGSIPHGTTINVQTFAAPVTSKGAPNIEDVSIVPFLLNNVQNKAQFPSLTAEKKDTFRIPQDLSGFTKAQTITQEMINNPNVVLKNANKGKDIIEHTTYTISTLSEPKPSDKTNATFGGATGNIGFLIADGEQGDAKPEPDSKTRANANASVVTATYWISTVRAKLHLTKFTPTLEEPTRKFSPMAFHDNDTVPVFVVDFKIPHEKDVTVEYTQIQYSQNVSLDFATLRWPHVTVATLAPTDLKLKQSVLKQ